jgi:D-xylose transport system permease protein
MAGRLCSPSSPLSWRDVNRAVPGFFNTFFGIPTFVVTLAGLIAWQGAQLQVLGSTGTVNLPPSTITDLTSTFYGAGVGWTLAVVVTAGVLGTGLLERRRRQKANLEPGPLARIVVRTVLIGAVMFVGVAILLSDRGVPLAVLILLALLAFFAFLAGRTRFGRHVYAVGGNAEAVGAPGSDQSRSADGHALASTRPPAGSWLLRG